VSPTAEATAELAVVSTENLAPSRPEDLTVHSSGEKPTEDEVSGMEIVIPLSALPGEEGYHISKDPRVKAVQWRDLVQVNWFQAFKETTLSFPWIAATLACFWMAQSSGNLLWVGGALFCAFYLFLTGLRQVHCAYHYSIGISRRGCDLLMSFLSIAMTGSMHVVQLCHLHHHRHNMTDEDVEGFTGKLKWWQAILVGPYFPLKLHWFALKTAKPNQRRWIYFELALNVVWTAFVAVMVFAFNQWWLGLYLVTMWVAQCGTGFFAVWTVHHGCEEKHHIARTQRGWFKNFISYQMFHHIEHHLFPAVPTCHWAKLGKRLDEAAPELRTKGVY
jgi:fatty acid desaturase